jgi:hypothetical protein
MKVRSVLDADMATVTAWLRDGFVWWTDELLALVPTRLRSRSAKGGREMKWDGADGFVESGGPGSEALFNPVITLPHRLCLARTVPLPAVSARDIGALLAIEAERIMPISGGALFVAAVPAKRLCNAVSLAGVKPAAIILPDAVADVDFLSVLRENGLIAARGNAASIWWAMVAFMFALNIALLVWRDVANVEQLRALVDLQKPAAMAAQRSAARMQSTTRVMTLAATRREQHNAMAALASISDALPDGAWVQRYVWDGDAVRLSGYKSRSTDPIKALRQSGLFADVRSANSDVLAEIPAGQPFDITARIGAR